jgi:threonine/homoserine/homoserine lactone efflux protein
VPQGGDARALVNPEFIIAATLIELTPGPNMAWLAMLGASRGRASALAAVSGIALGLAIAGAVAAIGVSTILSRQPWLFEAMRIAGALYLLYLAYDALRSADLPVDDKPAQSLQRYFGQGLLSNILNPKAYLFYAAVVPQFVSASSPLMLQLALLTAVYVAIATTIHGAIAIFSGTFQSLFMRQAWRTAMGRIFAGLLAAVAVWFYISTGKAA